MHVAAVVIGTLVLSGCGPKTPATSGQTSLSPVGFWAENVSSCGGGFDTFAFDPDGRAIGWGRSGTWSADRDGLVSVTWTSEGYEEDTRIINERERITIDPRGHKLRIGNTDFLRCPAEVVEAGHLRMSEDEAEPVANEVTAPTNPPDSFPMQGSYRYEVASLVSVANKGTSRAQAVGRVTRADATIYCEADRGGEAASVGMEACIQSVMDRESGRTYTATADCPQRTLVAPWGISYVQRGGSWVVVETGEDIDSQGMASGSASVPLIYEMLCR